ncbi:MAG: amidohydrolase family protein [Gemmatimonadaceae bacterium]
MTPRVLLLLLLLLSIASAAPAQTPGQLAIRNVTVIPMGSERTIPNATVVIRDGRIALIGPTASTAIPRGARAIDGTGKFLIPGLADMHTHLLSDGDEVADSAAPAELGVMLANGVTAARLMIGTPIHLSLRRDVERGVVTGPRLWVASPQITGRPSENAIVATNAEQAREAVRTAVAAGYDFIKLTMFITSAVYDAVVDEARARGIRVVGHIDTEVGVARALAAGQQVEHLDAYLEESLSDAAPSRVSVTQMGVFRAQNWASLDFVDDRKLDSLAGATARAGVYVGPTQNVFNTAFGIGETVQAIQGRPDWEFLPPKMRQGYLGAHERYWDPARAGARTPERRARYVQARNRLVKAIQDSGGRIIAGSDTPEWFHMYGWGIHRELQALVTAGLTPHQALAAATTNPAAFLGAHSEWGTVAAGRRADLLLLRANPLADIRNTASIDAVFAGGRYLNRAALDSVLAAGLQRITSATQP